MILPVPLAIFLSTQTAQTLGTYKLGDASVQALLPADDAPPAGVDSWSDGWSYRVPAHAASGLAFDVARTAGHGNWSGVAGLFQGRDANPVADWRAKFVLFEDTDILDKDADGLLRERNGGSFGPDQSRALQSIALLGSMIEAYSGGKLRFVPEVSVEDDAMRFDLPEEAPFDETFVDRYFQPRVNAGRFQPDDGVYRGPYNSIFFLHFGLTDRRCATSIFGTPTFGEPYFFTYDAAQPGQLAERLFNDWIAELTLDLARHGYQIAPAKQAQTDLVDGPVRLRLPQGLVTDSMWAVAANLHDTLDYPTHFPPQTDKPVPWAEARSDPWTRLPEINAAKLAASVGLSVAGMQSTLDSDHSIALTQGVGWIIFAEPEVADFVALNLATESPCLGFANGSDGPKLVFIAPPGGYPFKFAEPTALPGAERSVDFGAAGAHPQTFGTVSCQVVSDSGHSALSVEEKWVARTGGVELFKFGGNDPSFDPAKDRFMDLEFKPVSGYFAVRVAGDAGTDTYDLFASQEAPAELGVGRSKLLSLSMPGGWQHAVIPLGDVGQVASIELTAGNGAFWPISIGQKYSIMIGEAKVVAQASATPIVSASSAADAASADEEARARFAATADAQSGAELVKLLNDPSLLVQLNAANAFTRIRYRPAEDVLAGLTKNLDSRLAEVAMVALLAQGTDTGRGPILSALRDGPFEANKYYAAVLLAPQKDTTLEEKLSFLILSRSWETRLAGVRAIMAMPGDNAQKYLLGLLEETNPEIEATIARNGSTAWEDFDKRMQWYAVNDASDWMRFWSNVALLESKIASYHASGLGGLKDDSVNVRVLILGYLAAHPSEEYRSGILSALHDKNPEVRAEALRALAGLGPTNLNEISNVTDDGDPRVQTALIDLAVKEGLALTKDTVEMLEHSPDPRVAQRANRLKT